MNQKWRERMLNIVEQNGFELVEELTVDSTRSSHFTRSGGENRKREFESMLVLQR